MQLHDTRYGQDGPPVAFCHGLFGQGKNWTIIGKKVAEQHRVVLIDMPNHGRSPWTRDFDYVEHADIVADHLRRIDPGPWRLVGHSMGAKISMMLALRHPELVQRLVVVDMSPVTYPSGSQLQDFANAMLQLDLGSLRRRHHVDKALQPVVPSETVRSFLLQNLHRKDHQWSWQLNLRMLAEQVDRVLGWPQVEATFGKPVLWIGGEHSVYIREEFHDDMRALFPQTLRVTVKGAGHWVHSEKPSAFEQVLVPFLDGPPAAST
ncbi:MAG: alpha/beta hydrolase [Micrococcales bacterium]|nr:MAG: alpha/beta hydrolase [Micrococcales bacterium]PIE26915.1 MAG: alpha/beta hydrolase [Micrococcales bacterium]